MGTGEGVGDESGNIYPTTLKRCGLDMVLELTPTCTCSDNNQLCTTILLINPVIVTIIKLTSK